MNCDVTLGNAARDAGLCAAEDFVAKDGVTDDTDLTAKHAPLPDLRGTCHSDLCRHDGVGTDVAVVCDLHEVVQFHTAANIGRAHRRTVHAGVCADFNVILNADIANLRNLLIALSGRREAKTVGTDDTAGMQNDAIADLAVVIDRHIGIEHAVLPDTGVLLNDDAGVELRTFAHRSALADIDVRTQIDILADGGAFRNHGSRMNAGAFRHSRLIERQKFGDGFIGVRDTNQSG